MKAVRAHMRWHANTISTLTMAFHVETKLFHGLVVKFQSFFAFKETIVHAMGTYSGTVFTVTNAKFVFVSLVSGAVIVCFYVNYCI